MKNSSVFSCLTNLLYTLNSRIDGVNFDCNISHQSFFRGFQNSRIFIHRALCMKTVNACSYFVSHENMCVKASQIFWHCHFAVRPGFFTLYNITILRLVHIIIQIRLLGYEQSGLRLFVCFLTVSYLFIIMNDQVRSSIGRFHFWILAFKAVKCSVNFNES